jgi:hypothetical protein
MLTGPYLTTQPVPIADPLLVQLALSVEVYNAVEVAPNEPSVLA